MTAQCCRWCPDSVRCNIAGTRAATWWRIPVSILSWPSCRRLRWMRLYRFGSVGAHCPWTRCGRCSAYGFWYRWWWKSKAIYRTRNTVRVPLRNLADLWCKHSGNLRPAPIAWMTYQTPNGIATIGIEIVRICRLDFRWRSHCRSRRWCRDACTQCRSVWSTRWSHNWILWPALWVRPFCPHHSDR